MREERKGGNKRGVREELTPYLLWDYIRNTKFNFPEPVVKVSGVYEGLSSEKEYNGFYFGKLRDPELGGGITLKIPSQLISYFENGKGKVFKLIGTPYVDVKPHFSKAELVLTVRKIDGIEHFKGSSEVEQLLAIKYKRGKKNVKAMLLSLLNGGIKPKVAIFIGETAIVDKDILQALGEKRNYYEIFFRRVNLASVEFVEYMKEEDQNGDSHVIAIARGGGEGREVFDKAEVARELVNLEKPLVTAIGHAENFHLVDLIADETFITPTDFGNFLKNVVSEYESLKSKEEKEKKIFEEYQSLMEHLRILEQEKAKLQQELMNVKFNLEKERLKIEKRLEKEFEKKVKELEEEFQGKLILYKALAGLGLGGLIGILIYLFFGK